MLPEATLIGRLTFDVEKPSAFIIFGYLFTLRGCPITRWLHDNTTNWLLENSFTFLSDPLLDKPSPLRNRQQLVKNESMDDECEYLSCHLSLTFSASASVSFPLQVDRLMEMHFKYLEAVQQADKRIEGEKHVSKHLSFFLSTLPSTPPPPPPLGAVSFTLALI